MVELLAIHRLVPIIARAGGGGSGGSGGGSFILFLGYVPMHLLGAKIRQYRKTSTIFGGLQILGWLVAVLLAVILTVVLRGIGFFAAIGALIGMGAGLYGWFSKLKQNKKIQSDLAAAAQKDSAWDPNHMTDYAQQVFMRYQCDWGQANTDAMKSYLTPHYQCHASLMVQALQLAGRKNIINNPVISQAIIIAMHNDVNDDQDSFTIGITATSVDQLIDSRLQTTLYTDTSPFTEFWQFKRSGSNWLLDGIQQASASEWQYNPQLEAFAQSHGYYFSLDWGWLLLPCRGQLFGTGKFGVSDINNHIIGVYNQQLLVQLYAYIPNPQSGSRRYLIAQASLPRSYGNIVVRRKHLGINLPIRGLRKVSTEWPDFNKKYEVFATSSEQATSLELLNPLFMERLEALAFEVNIEVVDSIVYLYAPEKKIIDPKHYQTMLDLLFSAFKEMRL